MRRRLLGNRLRRRGIPRRLLGGVQLHRLDLEQRINLIVFPSHSNFINHEIYLCLMKNTNLTKYLQGDPSDSSQPPFDTETKVAF